MLGGSLFGVGVLDLMFSFFGEGGFGLGGSFLGDGGLGFGFGGSFFGDGGFAFGGASSFTGRMRAGGGSTFALRSFSLDFFFAGAVSVILFFFGIPLIGPVLPLSQKVFISPLPCKEVFTFIIHLRGAQRNILTCMLS